MPRFAAIKTDNSFVWPEKFRDLAAQPADLPHKGVRFLPAPVVAAPAFDAAAETVDGPTYVVGASSVVETWTQRALTAQEISDRKDVALTLLNGGVYNVLAKALLNLHNRIRVLEGQPTHTLAQLKAALKALL